MKRLGGKSGHYLKKPSRAVYDINHGDAINQTILKCNFSIVVVVRGCMVEFSTDDIMVVKQLSKIKGYADFTDFDDFQR